MKIASAQIACNVGDISANIRKVRELTTRAKSAGAELIVFPEMTDTGYVMSVIKEQAAPRTEGAVPRLEQLAQELSIAIVCGVSEREGESIYNSQVVIGADGEIIASYRKTHLFSPAPIGENKCFQPGNEVVSCKIDNLVCGLSICYDLRFPELYRKLSCDHGANLLINSTAWPFPRLDHLRSLVVARAIENQSYFILSNRVGTDNAITFCGSSMIVDPYGVTIASASVDREELIYADVTREIVDLVRNKMPALSDRRRDLY
jgi:omega-amidase